MMYGALVTKTNRIARILAGSKKKILTRRLRFMSATSQVAITWLIVLCECLIILFMLIREPADKMLDYPADDRVLLVCNTTTLGIIVFKPEKNNRSFFTTTKMVRCHIGYQLGSAGAAAAAAAAAALNQENGHYQQQVALTDSASVQQQQLSSSSPPPPLPSLQQQQQQQPEPKPVATSTPANSSSSLDQQLHMDLAGQLGIAPASLEAALQGKQSFR
ncbi:hypothetical protein SUGI_1488400 [Cryptomeria japonica]|uniref:G-protein coupled receptors family 3 profile domain-containing protein n=1 Tax=Cryptomeria japonica TaxID=3369 RepID=A0AAD3NTP7_CRYJA|nr:hypothetical protein SUGI_1488400 [Cryptomeria japonica]